MFYIHIHLYICIYCNIHAHIHMCDIQQTYVYIYKYAYAFVLRHQYYLLPALLVGIPGRSCGRTPLSFMLIQLHRRLVVWFVFASLWDPSEGLLNLQFSSDSLNNYRWSCLCLMLGRHPWISKFIVGFVESRRCSSGLLSSRGLDLRVSQQQPD